MSAIGIDIGTHRSKVIDDVPLDRVRTVITLCAEEVCPPLPDDVRQLHWPLPDPAGAGDSDSDQREVLENFVAQRTGAHHNGVRTPQSLLVPPAN